MNTIAFPAPQTPAQALERLCAALPERFRLSEYRTGEIEGALGQRQVIAFRDLEVDFGPGWMYSEITLQDGSPEIHVDSEGGAALVAVLSYAFDQRVPVVFTQMPDRHWTEACAMTFGERLPGKGSTPVVAALLALSAYVQGVSA